MSSESNGRGKVAEGFFAYSPIAQARQLFSRFAGTGRMNETMIGEFSEKLDDISFAHHELAIQAEDQAMKKVIEEEMTKFSSQIKSHVTGECTALKEMIQNLTGRLQKADEECSKLKAELEETCTQLKEARTELKEQRRDTIFFKCRYGMIAKEAAIEALGGNIQLPACLLTEAQIKEVKSWIAKAKESTIASEEKPTEVEAAGPVEAEAEHEEPQEAGDAHTENHQGEMDVSLAAAAGEEEHLQADFENIDLVEEVETEE